MSMPEEDELAKLIRWSLRSSFGEENPPAAVWWRIRNKLMAPPGPPYRRWLENLAEAIALPRLLQGAVTIALLVFMFTSLMGQPLSPWAVRTTGVTSTPGQAYQVSMANGAPEGVLSSAYTFQQTRSEPKSARKVVERAGSPQMARLTRVRDVAAFGFVPLSEGSRRVLLNPAEDILIRQLSREVLRPPQGGQSQGDFSSAGLDWEFPLRVIPSGVFD